MHTKSSIKNLVVALIGQVFGLIISFVARIIFLKILNSDYLGINGLFTNILTMLTLVELGIGPAMVFSLYKPLAEEDKEKIKSLMNLYKKIYRTVGIIILILGFVTLPLYPLFISEAPNIENLNLIYLLFISNTAISYFYSYKRSLIICDQKRYIATIYRYGFFFLLNIVQILILLIMKNYILYLVLQVLFTWLENLFISRKADKMFPYLKEKNIAKLEKEEIDKIKKNSTAMVAHKVGGIVVNSTDNMIIAKLVSLTIVGIYSNYLLIIQALETIILQIFNSIIASIGQIGAKDEKEKLKDIFNKTFFLNFWIFGFCSICLIILFNDFITLWIGDKYIFTNYIVITIVIMFYLKGIRRTVLTFRDALGLFYKDRYKPIFESIINLVVSIILAMQFGVIGVFLGTIISTLTTSLWVEPLILYKYGFNEKVRKYFIRLTQYTSIGIISYLATYLITSFITKLTIITFGIKLLICAIVPNLIFLLVFYRTYEFKYFLNLGKEIIRKTFNKKEVKGC